MHFSEIDSYLQLLQDDGFELVQSEDKEDAQSWWRINYKTPEGRGLPTFFTIGKDTILWQFPISISPVDDICQKALSRYLLLLNHELKLVRFTLDDDNQVHLIVELLNNNMSFLTMKTVFNVIRAYYDQYHQSIRLLATNPQLAEAWISLRSRSDVEVSFVTD